MGLQNIIAELPNLSRSELDQVFARLRQLRKANASGSAKSAKSGIREEFAMLVRCFYANRDFREVEFACNVLMRDKIAPTTQLYDVICTAIVTAYARPFTKSSLIGRLDDAQLLIGSESQPLDQHRLHRELLELRDRYVAHTDLKDTNNQVRFKVQGNRRGIFSTKTLLSPEDIPAILSLAKTLVEKTDYHVNKIQTKHLKSVPWEDGEYRINLSEGQMLITRRTELSEKLPDQPSDYWSEFVSATDL